MTRRKRREKLRINKILLLIFCLFVLAGSSMVGKDKKEEFPALTGQSLKLSGYNQVRYTHWEEDTDGFRIRRAIVGLKGDILKHVNYHLVINVVKSPILLDARVEISYIPHAKLTFGQFKVPFGLENLTSSSALDTINRSQTVENLCPGRDIGARGRDIGITVSGKFSRIEYNIGIFNGSGSNNKDYNDQKDIVGRLVFCPFSLLNLGLSHYHGQHSSSPGAPLVNRDRAGVDIFFVQRQLSIKGEYIFARDDQTDKYGWYVQGGFLVIPKRIQTIVRYDSFDENLDIRGDRIDVITIGLNWFFSKKTKLQINYEYHREESNEVSKNVILVQFQAGF